MIKTKSIIFPREFESIYLVPLGDFHIGDESGLSGKNEEGQFALKQFNGMIDWIKGRPNVYTFLMGDLFEVALKDTFGDIYNQSFNLSTAKDFITEKLKPIQDRILGAIDGNHEERIMRKVGDSPVNEICKRLGIDYFPNWCAYLFLSVGEIRNGKRDKRRPMIYSAFLHHMTGGGRTPGGKLNKLKVMKSMALANIYCGAHIHIKGGFKEKYIIPDYRSKTLNYGQEVYVATGSYMGYAAYSIKGMYQKPATGATRIRLNGEPEKGKDIHISI